MNIKWYIFSILLVFSMQNPSISKDLEENTQPGLLSDRGIIEETSNSQKQAEDLKNKIDNSRVSKVWIGASEDKSDYLKQVRNVRSQLSKKIYELKGFLEIAKSQRAYFYGQMQSKLPSEEEKKIKLDALIGDLEEAKFDKLNSESGRKVFLEEQSILVRKLNEKIAKSNLTKDEQVELEQIKEQVRKNENRSPVDQNFYDYGIQKIDRRINTILKNIEAIKMGPSPNQDEINRLQFQIKDMDALINRAQAVVRASDDSLNSLDDMSGVLLQTDLLNLNYSDRSTWVFGALVGLVIFGFFFVAVRSEKVTDAIFTGDSGIQFVTLFSVVIAIILFGILRILEGKELSALLGGLSGYILGRGNHK